MTDPIEHVEGQMPLFTSAVKVDHFLWTHVVEEGAQVPDFSGLAEQPRILKLPRDQFERLSYGNGKRRPNTDSIGRPIEDGVNGWVEEES